MNDPLLDINIVGITLATQELNLRCLKIHVRAKGMIEGLLDATNRMQTPPALFSFAMRLTMDGKEFPPNFLLPIEKRRLTQDTDGRLT